MRKAIPLSLAACFLCAAGLFAQTANPKTLYPQVKTAQLRASASSTAKIVATLSYGKSSVIVLETKGSWVRARDADTKKEGWVLSSQLSGRKFVLASGGATKTGASSEEISAAGKGFTAEIEAKYKAEGKVDYSWVDAMERMDVSAEASSAFRSEGGLAEGGAK
jgi:hypothetical protein